MARTQRNLKKPIWLKYTEEEVRSIIAKIIEKEPSLTAEKIGLVLRDNYGIPTTRIYGQKLNSIVQDIKKNKENPDLINLRTKVGNIRNHLEKNKSDNVCKRALIKNSSNLNKAESSTI
jgi:ribosomal protein S15P/S13E